MLDHILCQAHARSASDIHLVPGHVPMVRIDTIMQGLDHPLLTESDLDQMVESITTDAQRDRLLAKKDLDISHAVSGLGRYRVNIHHQRGGLAMALRAIREEVPRLDALNLPQVVQRLAQLPRGLVLVTGDTGSGKSTIALYCLSELYNQKAPKLPFLGRKERPKILFTTYTKSLVGASKYLLK